MKKTVYALAAAILMMAFCLSLTSCSPKPVQNDLWETALYTEDTELGSGEKTLLVEVKALEKSVTFTVHTDKETVGAALLEHEIIAGEEGSYGLYVKVVNGITADYDVDKSYWAIEKNGESVQTGVDSIKISGGEHYELVYTK